MIYIRTEKVEDKKPYNGFRAFDGLFYQKHDFWVNMHINVTIYHDMVPTKYPTMYEASQADFFQVNGAQES